MRFIRKDVVNSKIEVFEWIKTCEKKPDPKVYQVALEKLSLNPDEAIAIEDAKAGVTAARGAGLRCLASPSLYTIEHDLSKATAVVESLADRGDGKPVTIDYLEMLAD